MTPERKSAYRYLLYWAMLAIRMLCQSRGEPSDDLAVQQRQYHSSRIAGAIADWLHNLALAAGDDFERFNEDAFWNTHKYFCRKFPREFEPYTTRFGERLRSS